MDQALYEQHAALERDHWWFVARRAIVREVLGRHLPPAPQRHILDVGCGTGGMLPLLQEFGNVRGIDSEPWAVAQCRSSHPGYEVTCGRIPEDVPDDGSAGVVTAFDVIEHVDDDLRAIESFAAALVAGGSAVITVPALPSLWSDHDEVNGHRRRYTRRSLLAVVEGGGLVVEHASSFNMALLPLVAATRLAQRLRRRPVERHSDFTMPPRSVNAALRRTMAAERTLVAGRGLPIGVSLAVVARKP